jgi:hypothetical protein
MIDTADNLCKKAMLLSGSPVYWDCTEDSCRSQAFRLSEYCDVVLAPFDGKEYESSPEDFGDFHHAVNLINTAADMLQQSSDINHPINTILLSSVTSCLVGAYAILNVGAER